MKTKMLLTAGACLVLSLRTIHAQSIDTPPSLRDTLVIKLNTDVQIFFVGNNLGKMVKYKKADSLKTLLIADWEKAKQEPSYPAASKITHYFVHPNGKRRLKAENADYQEPLLDIEKEKRSLSLNLPPYEYVIYDLANSYELHIYFKNPDQLASLINISLNSAIHSIAGNEEMQNGYCRVDIENKSGEWKAEKKFGAKTLTIGLTTCANLNLIGSQWSPGLGVGLSGRFTDKRSIPVFGIDLLFNDNVLANFTSTEFTNFYEIESIDMRVFYNPRHNTQGKSIWIGLDFGYVLSPQLGLLNNNFKGGFSLNFKQFNLAFDAIYIHSQPSDRNGIYQFTLSVPIVFMDLIRKKLSPKG